MTEARFWIKITGMREQEPIQNIAFPLENKLQAELDYGTNGGLQVCVGHGYLKGRVPYFRGHNIHGPQNFLGVLCRKNTKKVSADFFLFNQIFFACHRSHLILGIIREKSLLAPLY